MTWSRRVVKMNRSRWWRGFWLCWFTGFGIYDLVVSQPLFAVMMAGLMTLDVILWMFIDSRHA